MTAETQSPGQSEPAYPELRAIQEVPLYHIPQALALDFDRTLANNRACMERLYQAVEGLPGISVEQLSARQLEVEAGGGTFDPLRYVREALMSDDPGAEYGPFDVFTNRFVNMKEPKILYDDAERFLDKLQQADVPHIILTWGDDFEWQLLKLQAAGYVGSKKIMSSRDKGTQVDRYKREDGKFYFHVMYGGQAEYVADAMVLVDDKSVSFDNFSEEYPGYKIIRGKELPSQTGPIRNNVHVIHSFDELTIIDGFIRKVRDGDPPPDELSARRLKRYGAAVSRRQLHFVDRNAVYVPYGLPRAA
jgi:hypothetical protein